MTSKPPVSGSRTKHADDGPRALLGRGLPSIEQARAEKGKLQWMPARFWKWALLCIGAGVIFWWKLEQGEINEMRSDLLARQRAVKAELGARWLPLRDKIEAWTQTCATGKLVEQSPKDLLTTWDFRSMPGIYLRLAQTAAASTKAIRSAAHKSLHDGFTSCLLRVNNPSPIAGKACHTTQDCARGELCNDYLHCAPYAQPYNLRTAYKVMYVMTDEWVADIQDISSKLTMRGAVATFEAINQYDLPVAADLLQRAKYFLVVVDEAAHDGDGGDDAGEVLPQVDGGIADDRSIPTASHQARVCVWRLSDGKRVVALRREAAGAFMGGPEVTDLATRVARRRQANSCALALRTREALGVAAGAEDAPGPPPGASAKPPADAGAGEGGR